MRQIITAYRCHGFTYMRGGTVKSIIAELLGRRDGVSYGKGTPQHPRHPQPPIVHLSSTLFANTMVKAAQCTCSSKVSSAATAS